MAYFLKENKILAWGTASRDATFATTQSGKSFSGFSLKYNYHVNEDGQGVYEYIEVVAWGKLAQHCGDEDTGVVKGDSVVVFGSLIRDDYYREGEDRSKPKYKINADIVLDATSIFQLLDMVVKNGGVPVNEEPEKPRKVKSRGGVAPTAFTDVTEEEEDPFSSGDDQFELPY